MMITDIAVHRDRHHRAMVAMDLHHLVIVVDHLDPWVVDHQEDQ